MAEEVTTDADGNQVVKVRKSNTGMFTQLISDARAAEWETIGPEDSDRLFYRMSWWKKVVVMAGGPTINLLIAFFDLLAGLRHLRPAQPRAGLRSAGARRGLAVRDPVRRTTGPSASPATRSAPPPRRDCARGT